MSETCPRCDNEHDEDDLKACSWVRAIEYHEDGEIRRVEYHARDGVQAPVSERRAGPTNPDEGLTFRERCILRGIETGGTMAGWLTIAVIVLAVTQCARGGH